MRIKNHPNQAFEKQIESKETFEEEKATIQHLQRSIVIDAEIEIEGVTFEEITVIMRIVMVADATTRRMIRARVRGTQILISKFQTIDPMTSVKIGHPTSLLPDMAFHPTVLAVKIDLKRYRPTALLVNTATRSRTKIARTRQLRMRLMTRTGKILIGSFIWQTKEVMW